MSYFKKSKKKTTPKDRLDTVFQEYVRVRDCDNNGVGFCISCGKPIVLGTGKLHAGHYFGRRHMGTRWHPKNCNSQCFACNSYDEGNKQGYAVGLIKKYGENVIQEIEIAKLQDKKYSEFEIKELIKYYNSEIRRLKKEKE